MEVAGRFKFPYLSQMAERNPAAMSYLQRRMDGMSMSSSPMFRTFDSKLARAYWYIIAGVLGFILLLRAVDYYQTWSRSVIPQIWLKWKGHVPCSSSDFGVL